jgi:hypothetical protein
MDKVSQQLKNQNKGSKDVATASNGAPVNTLTASMTAGTCILFCFLHIYFTLCINNNCVFPLTIRRARTYCIAGFHSR